MTQTTLTLNEKKRQRAKIRKAEAARNAAIGRLTKPIEEWDTEELARGRPRDRHGTFMGKKPTWVNRAVHEEAIRRFTELAQSDMRAIVPEALALVRLIIENEDVDRRGRWVVPPSVKLQAAQWVVEHLVGKPTQRLEADISVKLQGILANCLVTPGEATQPAIDVASWDADGSDEDEDQSD